MKYHLNRNEENLGEFPLEELRRKRESGELDGTELVWRKGMTNWQVLDVVLSTNRRSAPALRRVVLPAVLIGAVLLIAAVVAGGFVIRKVQEQLQAFYQDPVSSNRGLELARPIAVAPDTLTWHDVQKTNREFRLRHYLEGYKEDGHRDHPCDADSILYIRAWLAHHFGGEQPELPVSLEEFGETLVADAACEDPLILGFSTIHTSDPQEKIHRWAKALEEFKGSNYKPYPRFWVTVSLANELKHQPDRRASLDESAVRLLKEALNDGSLPPNDHNMIAETLVHGWGQSFFKRRAAEICAVADAAGPKCEWLSLVLDGEHHVIRGWRARGNGYANTVSRDGWIAFREHMAAARTAFTKAWELHPERPITASRMIYVAMGESEPEDMRLWFERSLAAQIDYPQAWDRMRWSLRPRWHGSLEAMLALGISAVNTERFDTDVPRKLFDVIGNLESELNIPDGEHIYARDDIWPHLERMYEGYIAAPSQAESQDGWRTAYAGVAYFAGKFDVARLQLEELDWEPWPRPLAWWELDARDFALEVAARTGSHSNEIAKAEDAWKRGDRTGASRLYTNISATDPDERTRQFVQFRLAVLDRNDGR